MLSRLTLICFLTTFFYSFEASAQNERTLEQRFALADSARVLYGMDSLDQMIDLFSMVIYQPDGSMVLDSLSGEILKHKARILRHPLGRVEEALNTYRERVRWAKESPTARELDVLYAYHFLGSVSFFESDYHAARTALRQADVFAQKMDDPDHFVWLDILRLLGNVAADDYDADLVRSASRKATALYESNVKNGPRSNRTLLGREAYLDASDARSRIRDYSEALEYALRGLEIAEEDGDLGGIIRSLNLVGIMQKKMRNPEKARAAFNRAIRLYNEDPEKIGEIAYAYNNLALSLQEDGLDREAREMFLRSIATIKPWRTAEVLPGTLSDLGLSNARLGRPRVADSLYQAAIDSISSRHSYQRSGVLLAVADSVDLLFELQTVYESRLGALLALKRPEEALVVANEMLAIQRKIRADVITEGSRHFNSEVVRDALDKAVDICFSLYHKTKDPELIWSAFEYSDQARGYSLMASLRRNQLVLSAEERTLRTRIAALERRAGSDEEALEELDRARLDLRSLVSSGNLNEQERKVDREKLKHWVDKQNTMLVSYHLTPTTAYAFKLSPQGELEMHEIISGEVLSGLIQRWRSDILGGRYRDKSLLSEAEQKIWDEGFLARGDSLVNALALNELPATPHLCIIPDGELYFLPFGALPVEAPEERPLNYARVGYLSDHHALRLAYTTELLLNNEERTFGGFLGMAPSFKGQQDVLAISALRNAGAEGASGGLPGLSPLANNQQEVQRVGRYFSNPLLFLGQEATRETFLREAPNAGLVHLSTHGVVNPTDPNLSFVAFAQSGDSLYDNDLLFYNELATLPLEADLVVLAACETSLGQVAPGETALSMASAFTAAGARSTLTSLWQVDDAATRSLMELFYKQLASGESRAEALKLAQAELREGEQLAHPYYWSAMTLNGQDGPVAVGKNNRRWWWVTGGLLVFGVVVWWRNRGGVAGAS